MQDLKEKVSSIKLKESEGLLEVVDEKLEIMNELESDFLGLEESIALFDQQAKSFMRAQQSQDKPFVQQAKVWWLLWFPICTFWLSLAKQK